MTVLKRTTNELVIEDSDLPGYSLRFARDAAAEQVVSVQPPVFDRGPVGLDHADILAALSWLADAAGVERYVPEQPAATCGARHTDDEQYVCTLPSGHYGWHNAGGPCWPQVCGATDPTTDLPCLLEPEHDGHLHRNLGTVWSR